MAVTIFDVAKRAGVSKTTVSAVLCDRYGVKKETKERVLEAIRLSGKRGTDADAPLGPGTFHRGSPPGL